MAELDHLPSVTRRQVLKGGAAAAALGATLAIDGGAAVLSFPAEGRAEP